MALAHNPPDSPATAGGYSQGVEVITPGRFLYISGQIPEDPVSGYVPETFDEQCQQVWANVKAVLRAAGMSTSDLIKVTTFLAHRQYRDANSRIRQQVLGAAQPALTIIIAGIYDHKWLLEIEATAYQPV